MTIPAALLTAALNVTQLSPQLSVRVVNSQWLPLAGFVVTIQEISACDAHERSTGARNGVTNRAGVIEFQVSSGRSYLVAADGKGNGLAKVVQCISLSGMADVNQGADRDTAYIELRLPPDASGIGRLDEPTAANLSKTPERREVTGRYLDGSGREYQVVETLEDDGIDLNYPDGRTVHLRRRSADSYEGTEGTAEFTFQRGRPTGFRFVPKVISAKVDALPR